MKIRMLSPNHLNQPSEQFETNQRTLRFLVLALIAISVFFPDVAMAEPWDDAANKVLQIFTGGLARTIAVIAVVALGIAALVGKLSWQWAIYIIICIVLIFGAPAIVDYIISATGTS